MCENNSTFLSPTNMTNTTGSNSGGYSPYFDQIPMFMMYFFIFVYFSLRVLASIKSKCSRTLQTKTNKILANMTPNCLKAQLGNPYSFVQKSLGHEAAFTLQWEKMLMKVYSTLPLLYFFFTDLYRGKNWKGVTSTAFVYGTRVYQAPSKPSFLNILKSALMAYGAWSAWYVSATTEEKIEAWPKMHILLAPLFLDLVTFGHSLISHCRLAGLTRREISNVIKSKHLNIAQISLDAATECLEDAFSSKACTLSFHMHKIHFIAKLIEESANKVSYDDLNYELTNHDFDIIAFLKEVEDNLVTDANKGDTVKAIMDKVVEGIRIQRNTSNRALPEDSRQSTSVQLRNPLIEENSP